MMKIIFFICSFFLSFVAGADRGYVIGNGGDGYLVDQKILLTDFIESGILEKDIIILEAPQNSRLTKILARYNGGLFDKKILSDLFYTIELQLPGVGELFARAFLMYEFVLVDYRLRLLPDREGRVIDLPEQSRRQIANRLGTYIRIDKNLWDRMSPKHQLGLIVHELVYSLIKYEQIDIDSSYWRQSARKTRELTALIFAKKNPSQTYQLWTLLNDFFAYPFAASIPQQEQTSLYFDLNLIQRHGIIKINTIEIKQQLKNSYLEQQVQITCELLARTDNMPSKRTSMIIKYDNRLYTPYFSFADDFYTPGRQMYLRINSGQQEVFVIDPSQPCLPQLKNILNENLFIHWNIAI